MSDHLWGVWRLQRSTGAAHIYYERTQERAINYRRTRNIRLKFLCGKRLSSHPG